MKLLILTQAVDLDDPGLGFFHSWIEGFAKKFEMVHVVCLQEGRHDLPKNVRVYSLGKPSSAKAPAGAGNRVRSRIKYVWRFYTYIFSLRKEYDAVFVHMNSEYVVLGGMWWRMWRKRVILWRNHKIKGLSTWIGAHLAQTVCYTSPSAYVKRFKNSVQMPVGIDTNTFSPSEKQAPLDTILFLGRLDAVKHPDIFLEAITLLGKKGITPRVDMIGDPTPGREAYGDDLKKRFQALSNVSFQRSIPNARAPEIFRSHAIYVNITPSGSFDKTIAEAAACECIVVGGNEVLRGVVPDALIVDPVSAEDVARGIEEALSLPESEQAMIRTRLRDYVVREHSLALLIPKIVLALHM